MAKTSPPAKNETGMVVYQARGGEEVQLSLETVKNFLVTGNKDIVTVQEMVYFIGICRARGLNPFAKDCYLVKYSQNEPAAIITAIDFYRSRAKAQDDCVGWEKGVIVQNTETKEIRYSKGLVLDDEVVVGGYFRAHPEGWALPWELEVNLREFQKKTKEGNVTAFWKNPAMMIAKVAESQGLRTLWPDEFRGTLSAEEAGYQSDQFATMADLPVPPGAPPGQGEGKAPEVDLGQYNSLLASKKLTPERLKYLEEFLQQTAKTQKKTKMSVPQLKEKAATNFEGFFTAFEKWEALAHPAPVGEPPIQEPPPGEDNPNEKAEEGNVTAQGGDTNEWDNPAVEPVVVNFEERVTKLWHEVIRKGVPLSSLKLADGTVVQKTEHFTPENIDEIQAIVDGYRPPRGNK